MHHLLGRQLKRLGLLHESPPSTSAWASFLAAVTRTYEQADQDRYTLERSLSLSSAEHRTLHESLRRAAASELASANAFLDSIVENIPDVVLVRHASTLRIVRVNRAAEALLGLAREQLLGKTRADLPPYARALVSDLPALAAAEGGAALCLPERSVEIAGRSFWLATKIVPISVDGRAPSLLLEISADVSERRRMNQELEQRVEERTVALRTAQEQLRQAQKLDAIGRLAGGVAHDFNNMLAVVLSCTEMALDAASDAELREDLTEIQGAARRASALTRQLLAFSRQQVLAPRRIDLSEVVEEMSGMIRRLIGEDIRCSFKLRVGLGIVEADPSQMQQVVLNLVVNARDAMPSGGDLEVETELGDPPGGVRYQQSSQTAGHVVLTVRDTGTGMSDTTLARLFEPFFTTKERGKGTGLGLATVYGIVRQSGGDVVAESAEGKGSTFRVYLPVARSSAIQIDTPLPPRSRGGQETVLVVEDDDPVRRTAVRILVKAGYSVVDASGADQALELAQRHRIHVVLTDVVMPGRSGEELAKQLAIRGIQAHVIFMSGYLDRGATFAGLRTPDRRFLQKPFSHSTLLAAVRGALDSMAGGRPSAQAADLR